MLLVYIGTHVCPMNCVILPTYFVFGIHRIQSLSSPYMLKLINFHAKGPSIYYVRKKRPILTPLPVALRTFSYPPNAYVRMSLPPPDIQPRVYTM